MSWSVPCFFYSVALPPDATPKPSSAASEVNKRQTQKRSEEMEWNTIDHYITLRSGHAMVEVETWVNNACEDHRLRLHVPTGVDSKNVLAGGAFDIIERPANWPHHPDWEQPHVPTHHFSDVLMSHDNDGGVALFCPGSNEYEAMTGEDGTTLAVTLLRATGHLRRYGFTTRRHRAGPDLASPGAQCTSAHLLCLHALSN